MQLKSKNDEERAEARMAVRTLLRGVLEEVVSKGDGVVRVRVAPRRDQGVREFKVDARGLVLSSIVVERDGQRFALAEVQPDSSTPQHRDPLDVLAKVLVERTAPVVLERARRAAE